MPSDERTITDESQKVVQFPGSLRDWLAGMAMQGWLASMPTDTLEEEIHGGTVSEFAYRVADAMLAEREK